MPDSSALPRATRDRPGNGEQSSTVAAYLRTLADALASPNATPATVLAAAGAREARPRSDRVYFRPPEPKLAEGTLYVAPAALGRSAAPQQVEFDCAPAGVGVVLGELGAAFGSAASGPQSTSLAPVWLLVFPTAYRSPGPDRPGAGVVRVSAEVATDNLSKADLLRGPIPGTARVVRVVLQRERAGLE